MNNNSNIESIFFAALEKKTTAEQADYLDHACDDDVAMRAGWNGSWRPTRGEGFPGRTRRRSR